MSNSFLDHKIPLDKPIVLFDGVCNLCNGFVQWLIKRDPKGQFRFASLQSEVGQILLQKHQLSTQDLGTVVLIANNQAYTHSDVALQIVKRIGGAWSILYIFHFVPRFIRDGVYNVIAQNRYQWFGQQQECMIPNPELKSRFL